MVTREQWATHFLKWLDAPVTKRTTRALVCWIHAEGTAAVWNPLATTQRMPGSTDFNSVGVQNYPSEQVGLDATGKTILYTGHGYEVIVSRLRKDRRTSSILKAVEASDWGTGGLALLVWQSIRRYGNYETYADRPVGQ